MESNKELRIKQVLKERGMSQAKLARMSDVNETSMSRIVRGQEPPFPQRGKRIADALGWKSDWRELFEEYGTCRNSRTIEDAISDAIRDYALTSMTREEIAAKYAEEIRGMME